MYTDRFHGVGVSSDLRRRSGLFSILLLGGSVDHLGELSFLDLPSDVPGFLFAVSRHPIGRVRVRRYAVQVDLDLELGNEFPEHTDQLDNVFELRIPLDQGIERTFAVDEPDHPLSLEFGTEVEDRHHGGEDLHDTFCLSGSSSRTRPGMIATMP